MNVNFTPEEDARIAELRALGLSNGAIAARMKRSRDSVIHRMRRLGLPRRPAVGAAASGGRLRACGAKVDWTLAMDNALLMARRAGMGWRALGKQLQVSEDAARRRYEWLSANTVPGPDVAPSVDRMALGTAPLPPGHPITWGPISNGAAFPDRV